MLEKNENGSWHPVNPTVTLNLTFLLSQNVHKRSLRKKNITPQKMNENN